ncbi:hypothetical protein [Hankyongella ginsenosidimutans]|uniref:hypothetical protein n=1 Tax=Hankyongella ginsenosidimutans TaxID=1763828 RepID=UPI00319DF247
MREQFRNTIVEFAIIADDRRDGAVRTFSLLPALTQGMSLAFASGDFTNTMRAGEQLAEVGPQRVRS